MISLEQHPDTAAERERREDILRLVPDGHTALDAGARDGYVTRSLLPMFEHVTALDLETPDIEGARCVAGNLTKLDYPDASFDVILCSEVLEHIPNVERACSEIVRVCGRAAVIGVPFMQDTNVSRTTCKHCGSVNPPWGHVNSFTIDRLKDLFAPMVMTRHSFVGADRSRTNRLSVWLMDRAGNPWGVYGPDQYCSSCGSVLAEPPPRTLAQRCLSGAALLLQKIMEAAGKPHAAWIHARFEKADT